MHLRRERATAAELTNLHIQGLLEGDGSRVMKAWRWAQGAGVSETHHKGLWEETWRGAERGGLSRLLLEAL